MESDNKTHGFLSIGVKFGEDNGLDIRLPDGRMGEIFFERGDGNGRVKIIFRMPRDFIIVRRNARDRRSRLARGQ